MDSGPLRVRWHDKVWSPRSSLITQHAHIPPLSTKSLSRRPAATVHAASSIPCAGAVTVQVAPTHAPLFDNSAALRLAQRFLSWCAELTSTVFRIRLTDREDQNPCIVVIRSSLNGPCRTSRSSISSSLTSPSYFFCEAHQHRHFFSRLSVCGPSSTSEIGAYRSSQPVLEFFSSSQRPSRQPGPHLTASPIR